MAGDIVNLGEAVRTLLLEKQTIVDMVGTTVCNDHLPQTTQPPAIVYSIISELANDCFDGPLGFDAARVQVDCYGKSRPESNELWQLVRGTLAGFRGVVADTFIKSVTQAGGQYYATDRAEAGTDQHRYRTIQDFFVYYHSIQTVN